MKIENYSFENIQIRPNVFRCFVIDKEKTKFAIDIVSQSMIAPPNDFIFEHDILRLFWQKSDVQVSVANKKAEMRTT